MEKGTLVEDTYRATRQLQEAGIRVGYFLQFGYPGEEWEDIRQTMRMVREAMPDDIGISVSYPLPGTKFYERVRSQLGERKTGSTATTWPCSTEAVLHRVSTASYTKHCTRSIGRVKHGASCAGDA